MRRLGFRRLAWRGWLLIAALLLLMAAGLMWLLSALPLPAGEPPAPPVTVTGGPPVRVLLPDGSCREIALEEFLVGVVAAEMPASFAPEALKAQAIAARTYVLAHSAAYGSPRHDHADICCDSTHCQAYAGEEQLKTRWGGNFAANYRAVSEAVASTAGLAVFYNGGLAETPYCSTCGGKTQAAREVWGADVPYLQSVECRWDTHSPRYSATVVMSLGEAARKLSLSEEALPAMQLSGLELRRLLGLDSANCQWLIEGGRIVFNTRGFGHGVGLCQYGADGMAREGYSAPEIIRHYYQGASLELVYALPN